MQAGADAQQGIGPIPDAACSGRQFAGKLLQHGQMAVHDLAHKRGRRRVGSAQQQGQIMGGMQLQAVEGAQQCAVLAVVGPHSHVASLALAGTQPGPVHRIAHLHPLQQAAGVVRFPTAFQLLFDLGEFGGLEIEGGLPAHGVGRAVLVVAAARHVIRRMDVGVVPEGIFLHGGRTVAQRVVAPIGSRLLHMASQQSVAVRRHDS